eukprot:979037-Pelagomonas_calceolata.AAC.2
MPLLICITHIAEVTTIIFCLVAHKHPKARIRSSCLCLLLFFNICLDAGVENPVEQLLRQFDLNSAFGPCIGMTRLARTIEASRNTRSNHTLCGCNKLFLIDKSVQKVGAGERERDKGKEEKWGRKASQSNQRIKGNEWLLAWQAVVEWYACAEVVIPLAKVLLEGCVIGDKPLGGQVGCVMAKFILVVNQGA